MDNGPVLLDIPGASAAQVAAYSSMEMLNLTPQGKRKPRVYAVEEVGVDYDAATLYVEVTETDPSGVVS